MSVCTRNIKLEDGRVLTLNEYGDTSGRPVFYFHGSGAGSGLYASMYHDAAKQHAVRLLAPDRPGIGGSSDQPNRTLIDWVSDIKDTADALGIGQFSIISESGGSAYAFVCAAQLPERISKVMIVSGLCPTDDKSLKEGLPFQSKIALGILTKSPDVLLKSLYKGMIKKAKSNPELIFRQLIKKGTKAEKEILENSMYKTVFEKSLLYAFSQSAGNNVRDIRILSGSWGIDLSTIQTEIQFWHGEKDASAPVEMVRRLAARLPKAAAGIFPEDTHITVLLRHASEIFANV